MSFKPYMIFKSLALAKIPLQRSFEIRNSLGRWKVFHAIRKKYFDRKTNYFPHHAIGMRYISIVATSQKLDTEICEEQEQCVYTQEVNYGNLATIYNFLKGHRWDMLEELSYELIPCVVIQLLLEIQDNVVLELQFFNWIEKQHIQ